MKVESSQCVATYQLHSTINGEMLGQTVRDACFIDFVHMSERCACNVDMASLMFVFMLLKSL
jgi:hypothetical protein